MKIEAIGIIGSNPTAGGLAEIAASKGIQVRIYDILKDNLSSTLARIHWSLAKENKQDLLKNIEPVQELAMLSGADLVMEVGGAVSEDKAQLFTKLSEAVSPECIIALNCGVEPITPLSHNISNPARIAGFNFCAPVKANRLVEIVRTNETSDSVLEFCAEFARELGKTPVIAHDNPGVIVERIRRPFILSAMKLMELGKGFPHEIDSAVKSIGGFPMGPFEMADAIGLDRDFKASEIIYKLLGKSDRLKPSPIENRLVQYGQFGKKSTVGFYLYEDGEIVGVNPTLQEIAHYLGISTVSQEKIFMPILSQVANEAKTLAAEAVISEFDIETAVKLALGWPKGPFTLAREMSLHLYSPKAESDQWGDAL